jgi:hypothetical protein
MFRPSERVPKNTSKRMNEKIRCETEKRIRFYATHTELIERRLRELDDEWDVERLIETEAPIVTLLGLGLGVTVNRRWLALPIIVQSMVLVHAIQGFYPLLPLFRILGIRTEKEIAAERYALKALRGDFDRPSHNGDNNRDKAMWAFTAARLSNL